MRLLQFHAPTMAEAMAQARRALGDEALILSSRRAQGGVELTAAIEAADAEPPPPPRATGGQRAPGPALGAGPASGRGDLLAWHGVPDRLAARLAAGPLPFALSAALRFSALPLAAGAQPTAGAQPESGARFAAGARPLVFVGPPGGGKTLTVARLATRLVLAGVRPLVVTTDASRAGADEQLAALLRLLGLALQPGHDPDSLRDAIGRRRDGAPVLIDTAGMDPFSPAALASAAALAGAAAAEPVAVLAAGGDAAEAADMAVGLAGIGVRKLVCTRLDLARRMGGVLAAAAVLSLTELGVGPGAADGLVPATPALLARRLGPPHPLQAPAGGARR